MITKEQIDERLQEFFDKLNIKDTKFLLEIVKEERQKAQDEILDEVNKIIRRWKLDIRGLIDKSVDDEDYLSNECLTDLVKNLHKLELEIKELQNRKVKQ
jgi:hypothetical protein